MSTLQDYYRPDTLDQAIALVTADRHHIAPLAGGTWLIGALETGQMPALNGVVDLARLGLDRITVEEDRLAIGAMATLTAIGEDPVAGSVAGALLRRAARGEGPINLRNKATIGGIVATAAPDSEFYAALLALDATVVLRTASGESHRPLSQMTSIDGLVTAVTLPLLESRSGLARVARTPSDRPIVAAVAVVSATDERVALCGVAERPLLQGMPLQPPNDFKGSAEYRRQMAALVAQRALREARG